MNKLPIFVKKEIVMSTLEFNLHNLIEEIENENLLKAIYTMITHEPALVGNTVKFTDLPTALQEEIEEGIEQAEKGEFVAHEEVMKKYQEWL